MTFPDNENLKHLNDEELVALYRNCHDKRLIAELYKSYAHLVLGTCIYYLKDKAQAEDAVLQVFEKLFDELKKRDIENFKVWLTFVVRNFCISELRKIQTKLNRDIQYQYEIKQQTIQVNDEDTEENESKLARLEIALGSLNPFQKKCIELFYLKNKSYIQIVDLTGYSLKEVKSYIQNGKRNLKSLITNYK
ncbi:MAG: sigma-70 family RNA polymerase sigma factor [Bacteroidota bacterium]